MFPSTVANSVCLELATQRSNNWNSPERDLLDAPPRRVPGPSP